jgi:hypothetical protein
MEKLNLPYIFAVAGKKRRRRQIHDTRNLGWRDTIRTRSTSSGLRRVDGGRGQHPVMVETRACGSAALGETVRSE